MVRSLNNSTPSSRDARAAKRELERMTTRIWEKILRGRSLTRPIHSWILQSKTQVFKIAESYHLRKDKYYWNSSFHSTPERRNQRNFVGRWYHHPDQRENWWKSEWGRRSDWLASCKTQRAEIKAYVVAICHCILQSRRMHTTSLNSALPSSFILKLLD